MEDNQSMNLRGLADIVGFAHRADQMDEVMRRLRELYPERAGGVQVPGGTRSRKPWRVALSPHDDYAYVGDLYPALLERVMAKTVVLFGVAHKARTLGLENQLLFDSFSNWRGPYGDVTVSPIRDEIVATLPDGLFQVNDKMQEIEHSVEAIVPFLQYYNREVEIVSILVPHMPYDRMQELALPLASAIGSAAEKRGWKWGEDYAIVISTDAVHYGDEDWGGKNYADFGTGPEGYRQAVEHERRIIGECLAGDLDPQALRKFADFTIQPDDYREYRWTWCGRYSVPCGLLTAWHLQQFLREAPLHGTLVGYGTSVDGRPHVPVDDLGMGVTAPANLRHWVGYASVGYE
jgi:AmmeMemoRadiSam system protein B